MFSDNYIQYKYVFVNFIVDHLVNCSRIFSGDLQKMLLLAIIGQSALNGARRTGSMQGMIPQECVDRISASRLADVTGIPRETVRRKLVSLQADGWIERTEDGSWRLKIDGGVAQAQRDLAELDARGIRRGARLFTALGAIGKGNSGLD